MTLAIAAQRIHIADSNGNPIVGAKLYVYTAGTTTLASIYSDEGLSVSMTNPLSGVNASDASGYFPRAYLAAGTYKLRAVTSADVLIWQDDNIDTGLPAGTGALPISRGGTGATTAAAARAALDVPSNSELTAITTEVAATTALVNALVQPPQGYLTMTSATPIITSDVSAGTAVYYTPDAGNIVPIWSGTAFVSNAVSELTLTLNANHLANTIYDLFVTLNSGTPILVTGPAWNTSTAGAGNRSTGAGTTELESYSGVKVNKYDMTARNGATTYAITARQATYVGSMSMDGTNGQLTCHVTWGQSRKWGLWNAYNRKRILLRAGDSTASWTYVSLTIRQSRATAGNTLQIFSGLAEPRYVLEFVQRVKVVEANAGAAVGIGLNSTTAFSGTRGYQAITSNTNEFTPTAKYLMLASLGKNDINSLETTSAGTGSTLYGTEDYMCLSADWMG